MTRADELRRLREELYRRDPAPGAVARYRACAMPRRVLKPAAVGLGSLLIALLAAAAIVDRPAGGGMRVEALVSDGPYAVTDRSVVAALLAPVTPDPWAVLQAVQHSSLRSLDRWDGRSAGVLIQQGSGSFTRRLDPAASPSAFSGTFSAVVLCDSAAGYRWTVRGTTRARPAVHVLGRGAASGCGRSAGVATFVRPAGAVVRSVRFATSAGTRWGLAVVHPLG